MLRLGIAGGNEQTVLMMQFVMWHNGGAHLVPPFLIDRLVWGHQAVILLE
jgi:hypothetical protein